MPKMLRKYSIYIAPQISGLRDDRGRALIYDEKNIKNLDVSNIDHKIKIYERQVKGWFLGCASKLAEENNSGFIVLMVGISYIEGVQQYMNGEKSTRNSKKFFIQGLSRIFQLSEDEHRLEDFYKQVRCGLFHNGMSGKQVLISNEYGNAIEFKDSNTININPVLFIGAIQEDFNKYIQNLKDENNSEARDKFNRMYFIG